jgi:hypothetical protein
VFPQARQGATFVPPHQAGVADHVEGDDGGQTALLSGQMHFLSCDNGS